MNFDMQVSFQSKNLKSWHKRRALKQLGSLNLI